MPRQYAERLKAKIKERMEITGKGILSGRALTYDDYRERVGRITGYRNALDDIQIELNKYEGEGNG